MPKHSHRSQARGSSLLEESLPSDKAVAPDDDASSLAAYISQLLSSSIESTDANEEIPLFQKQAIGLELRKHMVKPSAKSASAST
jgi:hypothetical protein